MSPQKTYTKKLCVVSLKFRFNGSFHIFIWKSGTPIYQAIFVRGLFPLCVPSFAQHSPVLNAYGVKSMQT